MTRWLALTALLIFGCDKGTDTPSDTDTDTDVETDIVDTDATDPLATIKGRVTRSVAPEGDGLGTLYLVVFDRNPILNPKRAKFLGGEVVEDAVFSGDADAETFTIEALPVSPDPVFVMAFLDENDDANPDLPLPNPGDLIATKDINPILVEGANRLSFVLDTVVPERPTPTATPTP